MHVKMAILVDKSTLLHHGAATVRMPLYVMADCGSRIQRLAAARTIAALRLEHLLFLLIRIAPLWYPFTGWSPDLPGVFVDRGGSTARSDRDPLHG